MKKTKSKQTTEAQNAQRATNKMWRQSAAKQQAVLRRMMRREPIHVAVTVEQPKPQTKTVMARIIEQPKPKTKTVTYRFVGQPLKP